MGAVDQKFPFAKYFEEIGIVHPDLFKRYRPRS
jgi:hypothetical protein